MDGMILVGKHVHIWQNDAWHTALPGGGIVAGIIPDSDYEQPKVLLDGRAAPEGVKRALFQFKVMHCGWECDEDGWVVEMDDGSRALVLMNHMHLYVAEPSELSEKLAEYERVAADTNKALSMLSDAAKPD
jgi:hypothetical protein